jgi:RNA polymerase sigma-70 factor (ECF subfamily)
VSLNRAVAVAMAYGPSAGLPLIEEIAATKQLDDFHLLYAARAELLRRLGKHGEASADYRRALSLVTNASERRHLERRLSQVEAPVF